MKHESLSTRETFVPCRLELELLAQAWWRQLLHVHFFCYCGNRWTDADTIEIGVIVGRLQQLQKELGIDRFEEIRIEAEVSYSAGIDPELWRDFNSTRTL